MEVIKDPEDLKRYIRDIPDYPVKGVIFRDLTPLFADNEAFTYTINYLYERTKNLGVNKVVAVEARGFIVGAPLAKLLNVGFVPIRKAGKLPWEKVSVSYQLEYGVETIEMHKDALRPGDNVIIADDLLATGGTTLASIKLVEALGARVAALVYIVVLDYLDGRKRLSNYRIINIVDYQG